MMTFFWLSYSVLLISSLFIHLHFFKKIMDEGCDYMAGRGFWALYIFVLGSTPYRSRSGILNGVLIMSLLGKMIDVPLWLSALVLLTYLCSYIFVGRKTLRLA